MARTPAVLTNGTRVTDFISIGVLASRIPQELVSRVLAEEGRQSQRQRKLPAQVVVYYVIGLALFMGVSYSEVLRCLCEGLEWLGLARQRELRSTSRSAISQARSRLGPAAVRRLFHEVAEPVAGPSTRGAFYRDWRIVSIDGSTLDVADTKENAEFFGRPRGRKGEGGFPKLRFVALAEVGTHLLFDARMGPYRESENALARDLLRELRPDMLCLADRGFFSYQAWQTAVASGAALVWRVRLDLVLPPLKVLKDGSYLAKIYPNAAHRKRDREGVLVRIVEYRLDGDADSGEVYRLMTTAINPDDAPALELAHLYHERWEIESAFDELKTHLRGPRVVLRSKTPDLVEQEFYGLLLAHVAIRGLMHEAAVAADLDPDTISFTHTVSVVRRKISAWASFPPSTENRSS